MSSTPSDALIRRTRIRLAAMTLVLIAALLVGVGVVTAAVAMRATDASIDRSLRHDADATLRALQAAENEPDDTSTGPAAEDAADTSESDGTDGVVAAVVPAEPDDHPPGSSDTFFLVLAPDGTLTANPLHVALEGLPDRSAAMAAAGSGEDWRTVTAGTVRVRLLTQRVTDPTGTVAALLQSGFVLTLHDEQERVLLLTVAVSCLVGLLGAALVTLLVTRRALAPVRSAFATERRFVAAASHELRTPVTVIRSSAEILQREDLVKPEGRQLTDDVITESDRLVRLVGDLLALASAEAGAITVEPRVIEMRAFVADVARRMESMALKRGVRLEVVQGGAQDDSTLTVIADSDRMTQLLLILIDNALDHSPTGGVVRLVVRPTLEGGHQAVSVGVVDQGPGVPMEQRERIFEPFARLAGRPRTGTNTGLGLAIARILASRQAATLQVDDAAGGGAVFSVTLPRNAAIESAVSA